MDTTSLRDAYRVVLDAAATVAGSSASPVPPAGEWSADQILAHVAIVSATTIATASAIASGVHTTYDNRLAHDTWTIGHVSSLAGGTDGLRERIRLLGDALCVLVPLLSEAELDTPVPTLLISHDTLLLNQPVPLRAILAGLAGQELPGHTQQLPSLLPAI